MDTGEPVPITLKVKFTQFISKAFSVLLETIDVEHRFTMLYSPEFLFLSSDFLVVSATG